MGSCVSVHKDPAKLRLSAGSNNEKILIPSPVKQKSDTVNGGDRTVADLVLKATWSPSPFSIPGSKEEVFFDSQPWLESDCEDDFLSVNGDFTPSRGSTPIHHNFSSEKPPLVKTPLVEPSSADKRKRLSELFKESLLNNDDGVNPAQSEATSLVDPKSTNTTPSRFEAINEKTPNGVVETEDESMKSVQCCLPRLRSSRSFSEGRKKTTPVHSIV